MSLDPIREGVLRAALSRFEEFRSLTTTQIAETAGVEETDLLRVFADKEAIFQACWAYLAPAIASLVDDGEVLREVAAIPLDQPLAGRLLGVIGALERDTDRQQAAFEAVLHPPASVTVDTGPVEGSDWMAMAVPPADPRPMTSRPEFRQAVAALLAPDQDRLRLPMETLVSVFLRLATGTRRWSPEGPRWPAEQIVDLFLHGALTAADARR